MIHLFLNKEDCCGCTACKSICPQKAISMIPDIDGFLYPEIDIGLCIECGLCNNVCIINKSNHLKMIPLMTYAAINKNHDILLNSSSGGVFHAIASVVLSRNGVVFGCTIDKDFNVKHIYIENNKDLVKLQGSKYVQSDLEDTYIDVKKFLEENRHVFFTGTPCQIAGLKLFLQKSYNNLLTADLVCHGVPSADFFKGYVKYLERKSKGKAIKFIFRDKSKGWGHTEKFIYEKNRKIKSQFVYSVNSYYHHYFLKGETLRTSCYKCKYASSSRVGDFTMGDYWGVRKVHPTINEKHGVSLFLVNSEKGMELIGEIDNYINLLKSDIFTASSSNLNLCYPTTRSNKREFLLNTFRIEGAETIAEYFKNSLGLKIYWYRIKAMIPNTLKRRMKNIFKIKIV